MFGDVAVVDVDWGGQSDPGATVSAVVHVVKIDHRHPSVADRPKAFGKTGAFS